MLVCLDHLNDVDTEELEALDPLHYSPVNVNGGVFGPPFPVVHEKLLCPAHLEKEVVVVLEPHCQVFDLLPIGCLIVIGDQAYHDVLSANLIMMLELWEATQSWGTTG